MEDWSTEMLCLRGNDETFGPWFNDLDFSDRVLLIETTPLHTNDDSYSSDGVEVERVHITSLILAAKSPLFCKLFKESHSKEATLKISSSEKTALMDLLKFMYSNTLSATTNSELLDLLIVADKFEVSSCMRCCIQLLSKTLMSVESAVSYLDLPSNVLMVEVAQPLIVAARRYLSAHFRQFNDSLEDAMKLSLSALEFVLGSSSVRVDSEDDVFDFILKWAHAHYPKPEECREIMNNRLVQFICFPYMSCLKLKKVLVCPEFDREKVSKLVIDAFFYKAEIFSAENLRAPNKLESFACTGHLYNDRVVKVAKLELFRPRRVVYFDLKKEVCERLPTSDSLFSQSFLLGGLWFSLLVRHIKGGLIDHFGLLLETHGPETCTIQLVIEVMKSSSNKFEGRIADNNCILEEVEDWFSDDLLQTPWMDVLGVPWTTLMSDDSEFFIDGILRLRVDVTILNLTYF